MHKNKKRISR